MAFTFTAFSALTQAEYSSTWKLKPCPGVARPWRRSHTTDNAELVRSALLVLSMITRA